MLLSESINAKSKAEIIAEQFYEEFKKQLPEGYEAIYSPTISESKACCGAKTFNIPNIDIYNRNYVVPNGHIKLINMENPRRIDFEDVNTFENSFKYLKPDDVQVAIHYPGCRRISHREVLPENYHVDKCVSNIIADFIKENMWVWRAVCGIIGADEWKNIFWK